MHVRRPNLDFSQTPARWASNGEFAQQMNAGSTYIPYLERFLNRVMAQAASRLKQSDSDTAALRADIKLFIRQEANHYAIHGAFNTILPRHGYEISAFERQFEAEFERLYTTKSFAFLTAYCEGFETMGPPSALVWLDEIQDLLEGADPNVVALWKWHLLEEYEHRTVAHDVFHHFHGGYFMRIYGFLYCFLHLNGMGKKVLDSLLAHDRAKMSPKERVASVRNARKAQLWVAWLTLPRMLRALSPFYTPRRSPEPRMFKSYMAELDAGLA